jgi:hypothetical protein
MPILTFLTLKLRIIHKHCQAEPTNDMLARMTRDKKRIYKVAAYLIALLILGLSTFHILAGNITLGVYDNWLFKIIIFFNYLFWASKIWLIITGKDVSKPIRILITTLTMLSTLAGLVLAFGLAQDMLATSCYLITDKVPCVNYWSFNLLITLLNPVVVLLALAASTILLIQDLLRKK